MRNQRVGKIKRPPIFKVSAIRFGLLASILGIAAGSLILIRGYAQSAPAQSSSAQSSEATPQAKSDAPSNNLDQQIGQLYQLATDLKAEVDKSTQEELSIAVVRKAAAIEQLAHKVRTGANEK